MFLNLSAFVARAFARLDAIPHDNPNLNETSWFEIQPCRKFKLLGREVIVTQPSSTFWVYLLAVLTMAVGGYYLAIAGGHLSRWLWGISLLLWGIGALLAGTSYQAFGYQLKCQGRSRCRWTNWWEVTYMIFQQLSFNVMLVAVCYSCTQGAMLWWSCVYAIACSCIYVLMTLYAAFKPIKSWLSFEHMLWVSSPIVLWFFVLNGWRFYQFGEILDLLLLGSWLLLLLTMVCYWLYDYYALTSKLWQQQRRWFSENDVLHVVLIGWAIYIAAIAPNIVDLQ